MWLLGHQRKRRNIIRHKDIFAEIRLNLTWDGAIRPLSFAVHIHVNSLLGNEIPFEIRRNANDI